MSTIDFDFKNDAKDQRVSAVQWNSDHAYRCHLLIVNDEGGGFSAIVLNLPGAGSCGDTFEEAVNNAKEAVVGVIEAYLESAEPIPWNDSSKAEIPSESQQRWVIVNAKGSKD